MNKLRTLGSVGGGLLLALTAWATVRYGGSAAPYAVATLLGVAVVSLPHVAARAKAAVRGLRHRLADEEAGFSEERGSVFVSESTVDDPVDCLEAVVAVVRGDADYDDVERDAFEEGPGVTVTHGGFHNSFVRVTDSGQVVVTGASARTATLADTVSRVSSLSFKRTRNNPFQPIEPVRGGSRVFLGLLLVVLLALGVNAVGAAAYSPATYNPAERTIMVGMDAHADLDPRVSATEARLRKAAFLVDVLEEEAVEVRWEGNETGRVANHGRQAIRISADARALLGAVREESPTSAETARADRIESDLRDAERSVAVALTDRAESDRLDGAPLRRLARRLRTASNTPA